MIKEKLMKFLSRYITTEMNKKVTQISIAKKLRTSQAKVSQLRNGDDIFSLERLVKFVLDAGYDIDITIKYSELVK